MCHSVSVINKNVSSEELEDRESLAVMAAAGQELITEDGEKYTKGVIVKDRLETPSQQQPVNMRKTMNVPNFVLMSQSILSLQIRRGVPTVEAKL